jgi:hypothetical protein
LYQATSSVTLSGGYQALPLKLAGHFPGFAMYEQER